MERLETVPSISRLSFHDYKGEDGLKHVNQNFPKQWRIFCGYIFSRLRRWRGHTTRESEFPERIFRKVAKSGNKQQNLISLVSTGRQREMDPESQSPSTHRTTTRCIIRWLKTCQDVG